MANDLLVLHPLRMRRSLTLVRLAAGLLLLLLGATGIFAFAWWQKALAGLSADGVVQPHTWQMLRIMLIALVAPAVVLLCPDPLRHLARIISGRMVALPTRRFLWVTLAATAVARLGWVIVAPLRMYADWGTYDELGWRMAQTGTLAEATHLTMYRPPGYPFVLSLIYRVFGHAPQVALLLNIVLGVGIVYLGYRLARRLAGEPVARWAVLLLILFPSQILYINLTSTEPLFTVLLLLAFELFLEGRQRTGRSWPLFAAAGLALGFATLTRGLTLPLPLFLAALLFVSSIPRRRALAGTLALVVASTVVVAPWIVRNYRLNGRATISTNGSMNFYIGNNPDASFGYNQPDPKEFAGFSPREEARIDSLAWARGMAYIRQRPLAFVARGVMKTTFLWATDTDGWDYNLGREADAGRFGRDALFGVCMQAYWYVFLLLAVWGIAVAFSSGLWRQPSALLFLGTFAYWLAVHFVFFGEGRYHYPLVPLLAAFAALALDRLLKTA